MSIISLKLRTYEIAGQSNKLIVNQGTMIYAHRSLKEMLCTNIQERVKRCQNL